MPTSSPGADASPRPIAVVATILYLETNADAATEQALAGLRAWPGITDVRATDAAIEDRPFSAELERLYRIPLAFTLTPDASMPIADRHRHVVSVLGNAVGIDDEDIRELHLSDPAPSTS